MISLLLRQAQFKSNRLLSLYIRLSLSNQMLGTNSPNSKTLAMCPPWAKQQEVHGCCFSIFHLSLSFIIQKCNTVIGEKINIKIKSSAGEK